jgi:hypothetical protein
MIETFFIIINEKTNYEIIIEAFKKLDNWYVGDGWYKDGEVFHMDYYNSYVIHSMLIDISYTIKNTIKKNKKEYKERYNLYLSRMQRYSEFLERIIGIDGSFPPYGRSITYRTACFQSLTHTVLLEKISKKLSYGQIKGGLDAVIQKFFEGNQNFDDKGFLVLGFNGSQPEIADSYSNSSSMYICSVIFLPLGLDINKEFWKCEPSNWTQKKAYNKESFIRDHFVNY